MSNGPVEIKNLSGILSLLGCGNTYFHIYVFTYFSKCAFPHLQIYTLSKVILKKNRKI